MQNMHELRPFSKVGCSVAVVSEVVPSYPEFTTIVGPACDSRHAKKRCHSLLCNLKLVFVYLRTTNTALPRLCLFVFAPKLTFCGLFDVRSSIRTSDERKEIMGTIDQLDGLRILDQLDLHTST